MIRNVVLVKLKPGQDVTAVAEIQEGLRNLDCPGTLSYTVGDDLALREGNWSFAIVADFADRDSYQAYDQDAEHNRIRARLAPLAEQAARVQFQVPLSPQASATPPCAQSDRLGQLPIGEQESRDLAACLSGIDVRMGSCGHPWSQAPRVLLQPIVAGRW